MPSEMTATRPVSQETAHTQESLIAHAPAPAQPILSALVDAQARHQLFLPEQPLLIAVSGGADSVCLLHALHQLAPHWQLSLHVAHVDHALRPDSRDDAAFVAALAHDLQLPSYQTRLTPGIVDDDPRGQEAAARSARYGFLRQIANKLGAHVTVATAHHQDDQAETLLLHLIQGSGLTGLSGMAWVGELPDNQQPTVRLVRPLLGVSRAALHDYLHAYGLTWREDSSNDDLAHVRNTLRHQVLPQLAAINPNIHATLARTAELLAAEADHADQRDRAALAAIMCEHTPSTRLVLDLFHLTQTDQATQRGALRHALQQLGIDLRTVGMTGIDALLDHARLAIVSGPHPLAAGWAWTVLRRSAASVSSIKDARTPTPTNQNASFRAHARNPLPSQSEEDSSSQPRRHDGSLLSLHSADVLPMGVDHPHFTAPLMPPLPISTEGTLTHGAWQLHSSELAPAALPADWRSREQPWRFFGDAAHCGDLFLTTFRAGMSIAPLGMDGHRRTLGDIFTDCKVPPYLRAGWPVVVDGAGMVVWLCGLVIAETVRVQPTTHTVTHTVRHLYWQLETSNL